MPLHQQGAAFLWPTSTWCTPGRAGCLSLCCPKSTSCLKTLGFKSLKQSSGGEAQAQAEGTVVAADLGVIYD